MSLGYNKNVFYSRPIKVAKTYLQFYKCHGSYTFDETNKVFYI